MQKIYAHIGSKSFDPTLLQKDKQAELGIRDKPRCGLWASPFNDQDAYTWEMWATTEINPNAWRRSEDLEDAERTRFNYFLSSHGLNWNQYCYLPVEERQVIDQKYDKFGRAYTDEEMSTARLEDNQDQLIYAVDNRHNSFYFTVNQDKILHIASLNDIWPYLLRDVDGIVDPCFPKVDFDKIRANGYGGVELHNERHLRNLIGDPLYTWDVDSIVVWDPDIISVVPKEIAYISRSIADVSNEFDDHDWLSDDVTLARWVSNNIPTIEQIVADGILESKEVAGFIERAIELDDQRRGLSDQSPCVEKQEQEETMEIER